MFQLNDDQTRLRAAARDLAESEMRPHAAEIDRTEEYPWENVENLVKAYRSEQQSETDGN